MGRGASSIPIRQETPELRFGSPMIYAAPPWWEKGGLIASLTNNIVTIEELPGKVSELLRWEEGETYEGGALIFLEVEETPELGKVYSAYRALKTTTGEKPDTHPMVWEFVSPYLINNNAFFIAQLDPQFIPLEPVVVAGLKSLTVDTRGQVFIEGSEIKTILAFSSYLVGV